MLRTTADIWLPSRNLSAEALNRWTHGLGCAASVPAAAVLFAAACSREEPSIAAAFGVYCAVLVGLYAASALSHAFEDRPRLRQRFRTADQVCIYLMIAGTFTPFAVTYLPTTFGAVQLIAMWLLASIGIVHRIRQRGSAIGRTDVALCLVTGWIPVLSLADFLSIGGPLGFGLVLAGGLFYSGGTLFLMNDHRNPYLHGVWHVSTLGGSGCHYLFLLNYVALP